MFIDVSGKVQWRANENAPWQEAKINDVVAAGVEVRTGLRSHAALRVGRNATALLDAGTLFQLPTIAQDGETLRTSAAVKHGRADFKVDKVGLSNDFKVVTPSTTLAVRGTEFAVASGALTQGMHTRQETTMSCHSSRRCQDALAIQRFEQNNYW
jgi:hypothetical protein